MAALTKGDIVLFPFPYTDLSNRKLRPCLVLSEPMMEDIILCQITSQRIPKDTYSVPLKTQETQGGSLQIDSYIRSNMLFTAAKNQIVRKVCRLSDTKYNHVLDVILQIIKMH